MGEKTKKCTRCGIEFPATAEYFNRAKNYHDGLRYECKSCRRKYEYNLRVYGAKEKTIAEDLPGEEWLPIVNYEDIYNVSNLGRVKRIADGVGTYIGRLMTMNPSYKGYSMVGLYKGSQKLFPCHKLVAEAFIGPRPDGFQINHKNGIKDDNRVCNLEYVTPSENAKHAYRIGLASNKGENHSCHVLTDKGIIEIRKLLDAGDLTQKEIGDMYNVHKSTISLVNSRKTWAHVKDE